MFVKNFLSLLIVGLLSGAPLSHADLTAAQRLMGVIPAPVSGSLTIVQSQKNLNAGSGTASVTVTGTTAGNLLVVVVTMSSQAFSVSSIGDNAASGGNSYVTASAACSYNTGWTGAAEIWYAKNIKAGATTVTVTTNVSSSTQVWVLEVAGANTTTPLDGTAAVASNATISGTTITAPTVSPTTTKGLVVSATKNDQTVTAIANSFVDMLTQDGNDAAYKLTNSTSATSAAFTITAGGGKYCASTAAFK